MKSGPAGSTETTAGDWNPRQSGSRSDSRTSNLNGSRKDSRTSAGAHTWLQLSDAALLDQCLVDTYRASGPGGQKRNKTDSAVRLRHPPSGLVAIGTESRSQHENKARALRRLRREIALSVRAELEIESYRPGDVLAGCISRDGRLSVGLRDGRYLAVIAEILDVLAASGWQVSTAASSIGVTTGNLAALISKDPELRERVNRARLAGGLKALR